MSYGQPPATPAYTLLGGNDFSSPLVLDSPHSGTHYPADLAVACNMHELRQTEDTFVDVLFERAVDHGVPLLKAHFSRGILDVNRAIDDIDPAILDDVFGSQLKPSDRSFVGHGLIRHLCRGVSVYEGKIPVKVAKERIRLYYEPYHAALRALLNAAHRRFGAVWHINCHSMASVDTRVFLHPYEKNARADFVLGDRDGTTCESAFMDVTAQFLRQKGYKVVLNDPYKGMEVLRRSGRPQEGFHSLQLEINRALYLNEDTLERSSNFTPLQNDMTQLAATLRDWALQRCDSQKMAAE